MPTLMIWTNRGLTRVKLFLTWSSKTLLCVTSIVCWHWRIQLSHVLTLSWCGQNSVTRRVHFSYVDKLHFKTWANRKQPLVNCLEPYVHIDRPRGRACWVGQTKSHHMYNLMHSSIFFLQPQGWHGQIDVWQVEIKLTYHVASHDHASSFVSDFSLCSANMVK